MQLRIIERTSNLFGRSQDILQFADRRCKLFLIILLIAFLTTLGAAQKASRSLRFCKAKYDIRSE